MNLFVKKIGVVAASVLHGGSPGLESRTLPIPQIVGLSHALTLRHSFLEHSLKSKDRCLIQKEAFVSTLNQLFFIEAKRTIPVDVCAPHILHLNNVPKLEPIEVFISLSNGSACQHQLISESHVAQLLNLRKGTYCRLSMEPSFVPISQFFKDIHEKMEREQSLTHY